MVWCSGVVSHMLPSRTLPDPFKCSNPKPPVCSKPPRGCKEHMPIGRSTSPESQPSPRNPCIHVPGSKSPGPPVCSKPSRGHLNPSGTPWIPNAAQPARRADSTRASMVPMPNTLRPWPGPHRSPVAARCITRLPQMAPLGPTKGTKPFQIPQYIYIYI